MRSMDVTRDPQARRQSPGRVRQ